MKLRAALLFAALVACVPILFGFPGWGPIAATPIVVLSATGVLTTGGNSFITGSGFDNVQCAAISTSNVITPLTTTASTTTTATLLVPALSAGLYTLMCSNQVSANFMPSPQALNVTSSSTPSTIAGACLESQYILKHAICSGSCGSGPYTGNCANGSTITYVCDEQNHNHIPASTGIVSMVTPDPNFSMPSVWAANFQQDAGMYFQLASFTLGTPTGFALMAPAYYIGANSTSTIGYYNTAGNTSLLLAASSQFVYAAKFDWNSGTSAQAAAQTAPGAHNYYGGAVDSGAATITSTVNVDNSLTATVSAAGIQPPTPEAFTFGAFNNGSGVFYGHIPELDVFNCALTASQITQMNQYYNGTYGVVVAPTATYATPAQSLTAGACGAIQGTGFESNPTVNVIVAGVAVGATTISVASTTTINVTYPSLAAGTYDIQIVNNDGTTVTFPGLLTVQASPITPEMVACTSVLVDWQGGVTTSGANATALIDVSGLGNNYLQSTGANQAAYNASDANFNNQPSIGPFNGSSTNYAILHTALTKSVATTAYYRYMVVRMTSTTGTQYIEQLGDSQADSTLTISGTPRVQYNLSGTGAAIWGSSISTTTNYVAGRLASTGTITQGVDVNANGGEVTATTSATPGYDWPNTGCIGYRCQASSNYASMYIAAYLILNTAPTTAQIKSICQYYSTKFGGITCT